MECYLKASHKALRRIVNKEGRYTPVTSSSSNLVNPGSMTIADIQSICHKFAGVTEDIKLGEHLCFNVGGKTFLFTHPDGVPVSASFKVPDEQFEEITQRPGIIPQPYIARYKWVQVNNISRLTKKEWEYYLKQSYNLIAAKLPAKIKKELGA